MNLIATHESSGRRLINMKAPLLKREKQQKQEGGGRFCCSFLLKAAKRNCSHFANIQHQSSVHEMENKDAKGKKSQKHDRTLNRDTDSSFPRDIIYLLKIRPLVLYLS